MTEEEKKAYRSEMIQKCKTYCHIDYDDDADIIEIIFDATIEELTDLIPEINVYALTNRQKLLVFTTVKELYDHRDKHGDGKALAPAISTLLLNEIYGGLRMA